MVPGYLDFHTNERTNGQTDRRTYGHNGQTDIETGMARSSGLVSTNKNYSCQHLTFVLFILNGKRSSIFLILAGNCFHFQNFIRLVYD